MCVSQAWYDCPTVLHLAQECPFGVTWVIESYYSHLLWHAAFLKHQQRYLKTQWNRLKKDFGAILIGFEPSTGEGTWLGAVIGGGGGAISPNCRADHMSECTPVNDTKLLVSEAIQREHICSARENAQV